MRRSQQPRATKLLSREAPFARAISNQQSVISNQQGYEVITPETTTTDCVLIADC